MHISQDFGSMATSGRDARRGIVGIDIDGVLNDHRVHFASLLKSLTGKILDPGAITTIPVHKIPHTDVTQLDEFAIFNWPAYWTEMPEMSGARDGLRQIISRQTDVRLFTRRPWPNPLTFPDELRRNYWHAWQKVTRWSRLTRTVWTVAERSASIQRRSQYLLDLPIRHITGEWLRRLGFLYSRLTLDVPIASNRGSRFEVARRERFQAFIEDNLDNAIQLSSICPTVILIDQPYNQRDATDLPSNVIRAPGWSAAVHHLERTFLAR